MIPMALLWQSRFVVPAAAVDLFLNGLDDEGLSVAAFEEGRAGDSGEPLWRVELTHDHEPDRSALASRLATLAERAGLERIEVTVAPLPATDWLRQAAASFPPQRVGRFWVYGSHVEEPPPADAVPIQIDAGLAFGSGEHATTRGCLLALDRLARRRRFERVLDLGCGSGILAIAAAKCWPARILAVDNDAQAVAVAAENARRNAVAARITCVHGDGCQHPLVRARAPFDLVLANLLADLLCDMARDLARSLAPGGVAILSGLFDRQAARVVRAHLPYQLSLRDRVDIDLWTTLIMARRRV